jgi:hypothetical protein
MKHFNFNLTTWKAPHWVMIIAAAFLGAALNYFEAIPSAQLVSALTTGAGLLALLKGAGAAAVISALGVALRMLPPPPPPPSSGTGNLAARAASATVAVFIVPFVLFTAFLRRPLRSTGLVLVGVAGASACTPAQAANVISTIEGYLQYVTTFIQVAQGIWAVISPLLGPDAAPAANEKFNTAVQALNDASVGMEDALAAARIANNPNPNLSALIAQCTAAADQVVAVIALYSAPAPAAAAATSARGSLSTLQHMQAAIHGWH